MDSGLYLIILPFVLLPLLIFLFGIFLKKFEWGDLLAIVPFVVMALLFPPLLIFLGVPFAISLAFPLVIPNTKAKGKPDRLELLNLQLFAPLLILLVVMFLAAPCPSFPCNGFPMLAIMIAAATLISTISLLLKRTLYCYWLNSFVSFFVFMVPALAFSEIAEDFVYTDQAVMPALFVLGFFAFLLLFLRTVLTQRLFLKLFMHAPEGKDGVFSKCFYIPAFTIVLFAFLLHVLLFQSRLNPFDQSFWLVLVLLATVFCFMAWLAGKNENAVCYLVSLLLLTYAFVPLVTSPLKGTAIFPVYTAVLLAFLLLFFRKLKLYRLVPLDGLLVFGGMTLLLVQISWPLSNYFYDLQPVLQSVLQWHPPGAGSFAWLFAVLESFLSTVPIPLVVIFAGLLLYLNKR